MLVLSKEHAYCTLGAPPRQGWCSDVLSEGQAVSLSRYNQSDMTACPKMGASLHACLMFNQEQGTTWVPADTLFHDAGV